MKTTINKVFTIEDTADRVWEHLSDPHKIVPCVPGATLTEEVDAENYKGEVSLKFGPVKAKYAGQIHFQERDNAARKMVMHGKGLDSKGKGSADMLMNGVVAEVDGKAEVNCTMEVTITGMLAQFGARLINDVTDTVFDQFVGNFQDLLAGKEVDNSLSAGKMLKGVFTKKK